MRIFKSHPLLKLVNSYLIDSPQPSNLSYLWNFRSLLAFCLIIQIITGVTLAMHYKSNVAEAFNSIASALLLLFFLIFLVYLRIGRRLNYGSYKALTTLILTVGTVIFILMMATSNSEWLLLDSTTIQNCCIPLMPLFKTRHFSSSSRLNRTRDNMKRPDLGEKYQSNLDKNSSVELSNSVDTSLKPKDNSASLSDEILEDTCFIRSDAGINESISRGSSLTEEDSSPFSGHTEIENPLLPVKNPIELPPSDTVPELKVHTDLSSIDTNEEVLDQWNNLLDYLLNYMGGGEMLCYIFNGIDQDTFSILIRLAYLSIFILQYYILNSPLSKYISFIISKEIELFLTRASNAIFVKKLSTALSNIKAKNSFFSAIKYVIGKFKQLNKKYILILNKKYAKSINKPEILNKKYAKSINKSEILNKKYAKSINKPEFLDKNQYYSDLFRSQNHDMIVMLNHSTESQMHFVVAPRSLEELREVLIDNGLRNDPDLIRNWYNRLEVRNFIEFFHNLPQYVPGIGWDFEVDGMEYTQNHIIYMEEVMVNINDIINLLDTSPSNDIIHLTIDQNMYLEMFIRPAISNEVNLNSYNLFDTNRITTGLTDRPYSISTDILRQIISDINNQNNWFNVALPFYKAKLELFNSLSQ